MVDAGKITLRIEVDAKEFQRLMKGSTKDLTKFKQEVDKTEPSMKKLGDSATTTAVRFQTLTQGTINLVTSFTQAYTSISNLQKAKTSLQAAAVGVERAIDLQRRKQFMLNEEMAKAAPNMKKVELLTNELATAHDDLAVKQQRVKDQADQVNDTYVLFALNIANVGFSAVQTGVSMVKMAEGTRVAAAASKLLNISMGKWALIATAVIVAYEGVVQIIGQSNKEFKEHYSIIENINRLMGEWSTASDITLDHYDDKISGVSTSTREFENSWKSMTKTVQEETTAQTDLVKHWERQYKRSVANIQIEMGRQKQLSASAPGGTQGNFPNAQQGVEARVQKTENIVDSLVTYLTHSGPLSMPAAAAEQQIISNVNKLDDNVANQVQKIKQDPYYVGSDYSALKDQLTPELYLAVHKGNLISNTSTFKGYTKFKTQGLAGFFGHERVSGIISTPDFIPQHYMETKEGLQGLPDVPSEAEKIQAQIDNLRMIEQELVDDYERHGGNVVWTWYTAAGNTSLQILDLEAELDALTEKNTKLKPPKPKSKDERNQEFLSTFIDENTPAYQLRLGSMSSQKRGLFKQRKAKLKQIALEKFAKENFQRTYTFGTQTFTTGKTSKRTAAGVFYAGVGSNLMALTQNRGGTFGMGNRRLGTSEGNMIEALRQAQMATIDPTARRQTTNIDVSGFEVDRGQANAAELAAYMGGASSLSEVRGSTRWDKRNAQVMRDKKIALAIKDANTNALRFGGTLREGMTVWDEGAVIGGYGSRAAYSKASKAKHYAAVDRANRLMSFFGGGIQGSRIRGRSSRRSEYNRVLKTGTEIAEALENAGLGYSTDIERLSYRHTAEEYGRWNIARAEVIAFNKNQLAKARQINLLQMQYGLTGFTGSTMSLDALEDRVTLEDQKMAALGLTRSQAIDIVASQGRGRQEIEDRLRFSDQLEAMSSGTSPL